MMKKQGFAISGIIYSIFILILVLMVGILETLQNRKTNLDRLNYNTVNAFEGEQRGVMAEIASLKDINNDETNKINFMKSHPKDSIYVTVADDENSASAMNTKYCKDNSCEWVAYGEGRTIISAGTGTDSNNESRIFSITNDGPETGGEYNHKLEESEMPSHRHLHYYTYSGSSSIGGNWKINMTNTTNGGSGRWPDHSGLDDVGLTGGDEPHNNLQPYIVVYMYKRIK